MDNSFKAPPPPPKSIQSGDEYITDDYSLETEDFSEYEDFGLEEETAPMGAVPDGDIYQEIDNLASLARSQGAGPEVLKALEEKRRLALQSATFSPEKREALMEGLRSELSELEGRILTDIEQAPAREELKKELQDLRKELGSEVLDEETKQSLVEKCADVEQALKQHDVEAASEIYSEAKSELEDAKTSAAETAKEKADERKGALDDLEKRIEKSSMSDAKKEDLKAKLEKLRTESEGKSVDEEIFSEELKALKKEVTLEVLKGDLKQSFIGFTSKIPSFENSNLTQNIAKQFAKAMESGDWSLMKRFLDFAIANRDKSGVEIPADLKVIFGDQGCSADHIFHAIRQITGTMFYSLAGADEKQFEQLLDLIPKEIRQGMYNFIMPKFKDNNHWSSNENEKQKFNLYGNGQATADRLEQSWQKDDIEAAVDGSDESDSGLSS